MNELTGIAALWLAGTGLVAIVAYLWGHHDGHTDAAYGPSAPAPPLPTRPDPGIPERRERNR